MNYLAHAVLSFGDGEILTGNMIADHVKGRLVLETFPPRIKEGILLHRKIDAFTDSHPATQRAKVWFREAYGLYSGAVMDILYDHFLAGDAKYFSSEKELLAFTQTTYQQLEATAAYHPENFKAYFPSMKERNWLYNYRTVQGVQRSLGGLKHRAKYISEVDTAYKIFITYYYQLAQCYYEFIDDIMKFVKIELSH
jgi:acyl carrier protein phosphodiesterase